MRRPSHNRVPPARSRPRIWHRGAFSLVELLIVCVLLGVLAVVLIPLSKAAGDQPGIQALGTNVRAVQLLLVHRNTGAGYPANIESDWFMGNRMPIHTLANRRMVVEAVADAADVVYPADKTFNSADPAPLSCWYNSTNGSFCARVPAQATDWETVVLFNKVNRTSVLMIDQTTE